MELKSDIVFILNSQFNKGMAQGIEKGIYVKTTETARNLKNIDLSIENIAKATGISIDEMEKLYKK